MPEHLRPQKLLAKNILNSLKSFATKIGEKVGSSFFKVLISCTDTKETNINGHYS